MAKSECRICGKMISKIAGHSKLHYKHKCPHGEVCVSSDSLIGRTINRPSPVKGCKECYKEYRVKQIIELEMKSVARNLDNNKMDNFSFNIARQKCVQVGIFKDVNEALFWFDDNETWLTKTYNKLNKEYQVI